MISQGELRNLLEYDPETGLWRWRDPYKASRRKRSWFDGTPTAYGHRVIRLDGVLYPAHLLAWLYVYGVVVLDLDHKDRIGSHNWISNLRPANRSQQTINSADRWDNKQGARGVTYFEGRRKPWRARVTKDGVNFELYCLTKEEAMSWRLKKAEELFGEFVPKVVPLDRK